jgi:UDP-N-acetylmuramoylalanine--D-glutamate ligase
MNHLQGITVLVLGLGDSGVAMARWCARFGAAVRVWDSRSVSGVPPPNTAALAEAVPDVQWVAGALTDAAFAGVRLVLKSPGLSPFDARIAGPLNRAADSGALVQGELELFAHALRELHAERGYAPKVLAITGTNGKTTTTAMAAMLIARAGKRVAVAGNIGPTMLQTLADALDLELAPAQQALPVGADADVDVDVEDITDLVTLDGALADDVEPATEALSEDSASPAILAAPEPAAPVFDHLPDVWVLELSSFQLDEAKGFEPSAAAVLNITQDHLDWHGSMGHYIAAKARVFGKKAVMVINRDDPLVEQLVPVPEVVKGGKGKRSVTVERKVVRFGTGAPQRPGDFGLVEENGMAWLVRARELDETLKRGLGGRGGNGAGGREAEALLIQRLMPADALRVRGRHNAANALAALALATAIGCPLAPMLHGLREYSGEPHRVQFIATLDGVDAFDDSKGTNVGATVAALNGLGADKSPAKLVVILGGDGKGQDFAPLAEPVQRHARAVALIGRDAERIEQALESSGVPMQRHASLEAATRWCFEHAHAGDAVLLSPACASLDMFRNYAHRAELFVAEVHAVIADRGGIAA